MACSKEITSCNGVLDVTTKKMGSNECVLQQSPQAVKSARWALKEFAYSHPDSARNGLVKEWSAVYPSSMLL